MLRFCIFLFCLGLASAALHGKHQLKRVPLGKTINTRIINGELAEAGQFPWQAALYLLIDGHYYFCGGTIIHKDWILSSGSCLHEVESALVQTGIINIDDIIGEEIRESEQIILHESFNPDDLEHSIGLIKLKRSLDLNDRTNVIALAEERVEEKVEVVVSGWGSVSNNAGDLSDELRYAYLETMSHEDCVYFYGEHFIFDENLCAIGTSEPAKGPCAGDTGGPLVANINTIPTVVGVTDFISVAGCEAGHAAGFTRVSPYRDWIKEKTGI